MNLITTILAVAAFDEDEIQEELAIEDPDVEIAWASINEQEYGTD